MKKEKGSMIIGIVLLVAVVSLSYIGYRKENSIKNTNYSNNISQISKYDTNNIEAIEVVKNTINTVVGISTKVPETSWYFSSQVEDSWGVGTGIIVSNNGYILTNEHVAGKKENSVIVTLSDGTNINGKTVWADSKIDLAIIKIEGNNLPVATLGTSKNLQVGENVIAIGNPLGLEFQRTVTSGIVSALNRALSVSTSEGNLTMEGLIQTDASINPGNSGGPLINSKGEVVGINALKLSTAEGLGFAIPIDLAIPIINQYINTNNFEPTYAGFYGYEKSIVPLMYNGINLDKGLYIAEIDGPMKKSGFKSGDIITNIDGEDINTMLDVKTILYNHKIGDKIKITAIIDGNEKESNITLEKKDEKQNKMCY